MGIQFTPEVAELPTPDLQRAHSYWCSLRTGRGVPLRADLDPAAIVGLLPKVNLVDVVEGGVERRYRHRLVGTGVVSLFRVDSTGCWFDDIYAPDHLDAQLPAYDRAVATGAPNVDTVTVALPGSSRGLDLGYWRLILPMSRGGDRVDMLFLVFDQLSTDPKYTGMFPLYRAAGLRAAG